MKILVTGATGFIGHHVVSWLTNNTQHEIIASGTNREKAKTYEWYSRVTFIPCDYFKYEQNYYEFFEKPDILIHLGWKNAYENTKELQIEENLPKTLQFLKSFIDSKHTKIVGMGTSQEYGDIPGCLSETMPAHPNTPYGIAKDKIRQYIETKAKETPISWNWIRQFYLIGDGQNPKSLLGQLETAINTGKKEFPMSGGEQLRDYIKVELAAELICKISLQKKYSGIVNSCTGTPRSLRDIVENIISDKHANLKVLYGYYPYREYEVMEQWGNPEKLHEIINAEI